MLLETAVPGLLLAPKVKVFFSTHLNAYITPTIINISEHPQTEKIVERVLAKQYGFINTQALWHGDCAKL